MKNYKKVCIYSVDHAAHAIDIASLKKQGKNVGEIAILCLNFAI